MTFVGSGSWVGRWGGIGLAVRLEDCGCQVDDESIKRAEPYIK